MSGFNELGQIRLPPKTQGQDANISGKLCEANLVAAFKLRGVNVWPYVEQVEDLFVERTLRSNVPYRSIYGSISRSELVYYHGGGLAVRIECRAQQTSGSVDEKFPYLLANAKIVQEPAVWLVLGGLGARDRAVEWLRRNAHSHDGKIIRVYTEIEARAAVKGLVENGIADAKAKPGRRTSNPWLTA